MTETASITTDNREKELAIYYTSEKIAKELKLVYNTAREELGDLVIRVDDRSLIIELKEIKDLVYSSLNGRLYEQAQRLLQVESEKTEILIVAYGSLDFHVSVKDFRWLNDRDKRYSYIFGVIDALASKYRIPIQIHKSNIKSLYERSIDIESDILYHYLKAKCRRFVTNKNKEAIKTRFAKKVIVHNDIRVKMISQIGYLSPNTVAELLNKFSSFEEFVNANAEEYIIKGKISQKRAMTIKEIFKSKIENL